MNCPKCGSEINENQNFCSSCGTKLVKETFNFMSQCKSFISLPIICGLCIITGLFLTIGYVINSDTNKITTENISKISNENNISNFEVENTQTAQNCVYRTSNGVCFTTPIFKVEPIKMYTTADEYKYASWLASKDACESQGYKLPSDYELRSLFSDILGIYINSGVDIKTTKDMHAPPAKNYEILKKIAPQKEDNSFWLWENEEFDDTRAYKRGLNSTFADNYETSQFKTDKFDIFAADTICVYDPNGKPHKPLSEIEKEKKEKAEKQKQLQEQLQKKKREDEQKQIILEAENALF